MPGSQAGSTCSGTRRTSSTAGSPDGSVSHAFLVLVAPPWDDRLYLKLYKEAAEIFLRDDALPYLLRAQSETEILRFFRDPTVAAEDW